MSERTYHNALDLQDALIKQFPAIPEYRSALGRTLFSLAFLRRKQGDLAGAHRRLDEAIKHQRRVLEDNPRSDLGRAQLRGSLGLLAETLIQLRDYAGAASAAEELPKVFPDDPWGYLLAATDLTRCMTHTDEAPRAEEYAQKAISLLREAIARKLIRNVSDLDQKEFEPLRQREDFKELHERLMNSTRIGTG
jgi:tetratricopeptide (TPR) repeat protein